jgi:hypothetical protein
VVTRRWFLLGVGFAFGGCASAQETIQREFTPGQLKPGSHIHAFQTSSFAYAFTQGHMMDYEARLERVEDDAPAFFEALDRAGWAAAVDVVPHMNRSRDLEYEYYDVDLVLVPKDPKSRDHFLLPGAQGISNTKYIAALAPAATKIGIPAEVIRRGHFALFTLATLSGSLNATDDSMKRHAFRLLVLREKLKNGEKKIDYLAPLRPANESLEDVDVALRVIADHHRTTSKIRAEVIGLTALARTAGDAKARATLVEQLGESRKAARAWLDTHEHRPEMEDFGVAMKELKLPTPDNLLAVLDKEGYVTAAITVAKGVATGDAATTIEGVGKLAPKDSSLRTASEGIAAALRGDIPKTVDSVLTLAQTQEDVAPLVARLRAVEQTVTNAKNVVNDAKGVANDAKNVVNDPKGALKKELKK